MHGDLGSAVTELKTGELLLDLALLFALTYLLAALLERRRIPGILAALFVAMAVHSTPLGVRLLSPEFHVPLSFLAELGVLFLLFFIGLQVWAVYVPFLQKALHTAPLGLADWGLIFMVALPIFVMAEAYKWLRRRRTRRNTVALKRRST